MDALRNFEKKKTLLGLSGFVSLKQQHVINGTKMYSKLFCLKNKPNTCK